MQNLHHLINQLESKISQFETTNHSVSGGSVGWHIEHSLKTILYCLSCERNIDNDFNQDMRDYERRINFIY